MVKFVRNDIFEIPQVDCKLYRYALICIEESWLYIDILNQKWRHSSVLEIELRLFCIESLIIIISYRFPKLKQNRLYQLFPTKDILHSPYHILAISVILPSFAIFVARRIMRNWKRFKNDRILYNDYDSTDEDLQDNNRSSTVLLNRLKNLLLETFKSLRYTNAKCLHDISTLRCPHMTWEPQILCNRKGTKPLTG